MNTEHTNIEMDQTWQLCEGDTWYATVQAKTAEAALAIARANVDAGNYDSELTTVWIPIRVRCAATDEEDTDTVGIDPPEPRCSHAGRHDWRAPHAIVGGLKENPGVWGHGGGVVILEVCMQCGCGRTTDTWAHDPSTGEQGLESVTYEPGQYEWAIAPSSDE